MSTEDDDDPFTEDASEPCLKRRGITIDDFIAYLPSHRPHLHAVPRGVDRRE
jgi:hypothetical protein